MVQNGVQQASFKQRGDECGPQASWYMVFNMRCEIRDPPASTSSHAEGRKGLA